MDPDLLNNLTDEFCPPLDSSLLTILVSEIHSDAQGNPLVPNQHQINELKLNLRELAAQADAETQLSEHFASGLAVHSESTDATSSSAVSDLFLLTDSSAPTTVSSMAFDGAQSALARPLAFLQAALPHIPADRIRQALLEADPDASGDVDMWDIMAIILSEEIVRELEERGLDGLDDEDASLARAVHEAEATETWTVSAGSKPSGRPKAKKRGSTKITLSDVRQQQHHHPRANSLVQTSPPRPTTAVSDPWLTVSSISSHLATLIPSQTAPYFQSYFHSPAHPTPYKAVRASLENLAAAKTSSSSEVDDTSALFITVLDILLPQYESVFDNAPEKRSQLMDEIELCIVVTDGQGESILSLVELLRDLDSDSSTGSWEMGVYHTAPVKPIPEHKSPTKKQSIPFHPPDIPRPPNQRSRSISPPNGKRKANTGQWQQVPYRKPAPNTNQLLLAAHIPAYTRDVNGMKVGRNGARGVYALNGQGSTAISTLQKKIGENMRRRDDMLREASRMYKKADKKWGGDVAAYFAGRAREYQELAKQDALNVSRMLVESRRLTSEDPDTIDLHGTTATEAVQIVRETLQKLRPSAQSSKPFKIVTGRGSHSANQTSVLKPAIKKALVDDGWSVSTWDGGLVVPGRYRQ